MPFQRTFMKELLFCGLIASFITEGFVLDGQKKSQGTFFS